MKLLLMKDIFIGNLIEKRISYKIIKLHLVVSFSFFSYSKRRLPVLDFSKCFPAALPDKAVVDKELTSDGFSFVGK